MSLENMTCNVIGVKYLQSNYSIGPLKNKGNFVGMGSVVIMLI